MIKKYLILLTIIFYISCSVNKSIIRPKKKAIRGTILYYSLIAQKHYDNRDYRKSIFNYQKILKNFADQERLYQEQFAWTYYEIGYNYIQLKDYFSALKNFQIIIDKYNNIPATAILARQRIEEINKLNQVKESQKNKNNDL